MQTPELFQQLACLGVLIGVEPWNPTCAMFGMERSWLSTFFEWGPLLLVVGLLIGFPLGVYVVDHLIGVLADLVGFNDHRTGEYRHDD